MFHGETFSWNLFEEMLWQHIFESGWQDFQGVQEFPGGGGLEKYPNKMEFPRGWGVFRGVPPLGGTDNFWNYTVENKIRGKIGDGVYFPDPGLQECNTADSTTFGLNPQLSFCVWDIMLIIPFVEQCNFPVEILW